MRQRLSAAGMDCPEFRLVADAHEAEAAGEAIGYPVIVKPTDRSGSVGVSLVESSAGSGPAFERAQSESRSGGVLVEEFIGGREISAETICHAGHFSVVAVTDKLTTGPPYFVELGHCVPSTLPPVVLDRVRETARQASEALGIDWGPTHTEIKITNGRVVVIELGARLGGDRITSHLVPLATGIDLVAASIQVALGETPALTPGEVRSAAIRYLQAPPGQVTAIDGVESARALPGVQEIGLDVKVGEAVPPLRSSGDRPGWVIAVGSAAGEAIQQAEAARDAISVVTVPVGVCAP